MPQDISSVSPEKLREQIGVGNPEDTFSKSDKIRQHGLLLKSIRERVRDDNDLTMAYSGSEGSGKSTLAIKHGLDLDDTAKQWESWVDDNIIVNPDPEQLQNRILQGPFYSTYIVDEAIRILYKRDFGSFSNKFLVKLFAISRKCKKIISLCIPDFNDLDPYYRKHRVKLWWYVPYRGRAVAFMPWTSPFCRDPWLIDENEKNMRKALGNKSVAEYEYQDMINAFKKTPNYIMDFEFNKMPEKIEARYLKNVEQLRKDMDFKKEQEREIKDKKNKYKDLFYDARSDFARLTRFLSQKGAMSYADTARILEKDKKTVEQRLEMDWQYQLKKKRKSEKPNYNNG